MKPRSTFLLRLVSCVLLMPAFALMAGCVICVDADHGCSWGMHMGPTHWTAPETERLAFNAAGMEALVVRTHNGSVEFVPTAAGEEAYVEVTKKAGGHSLGNAEEAMKSLQVFVDSCGSLRHVGYRWTEWKRPDWSAHVSFRIHAPSNVKLDVETHNGPITAEGLAGSGELLSHNGDIVAASSGKLLRVETHNGRIDANYSGQEIQVETHNGRISANLSGCGKVSGDITSHNGRIELVVSERTSTKLVAETDNGKVTLSAKPGEAQISAREVTVDLGSGEGRLEVTTHNGGVTVSTTKL